MADDLLKRLKDLEESLARRAEQEMQPGNWSYRQPPMVLTLEQWEYFGDICSFRMESEMVNWNSRGIRVGMKIPLNLTVTKVTERDGFRHIHLKVSANDLPAGFDAREFVITVPVSAQDVTLDEANNR